MSEPGVPAIPEGLTLINKKAAAFYDTYERKSELKHQTHYCPGCGHGVAHKLVARAIDELGIQDRVILVSPVGCSVFAYYYFDVGNVQVAHGRAPACATGIKRARPEAVVVSYQGDGDLAAIGTAEILHAANRGEPISVIFINNAIYGMTGGQLAPTTPVGTKSTTTPYGRNVWNEGYPLHIVETLAALEAPVYLERVALGSAKQDMQAFKAIRRALEIQVSGLGFSLVEVLSPCPTIWRDTPVEAQRRVREELAAIYPLGVVRDKTGSAPRRPAASYPPSLEKLPALLDIEAAGAETEAARAGTTRCDWRIKVAGFGGQGVLMLGEVLAEAGLAAGLEVSWLPSYGPEMRSGTSNCHVRLSSAAIDSPLVSRPNVLIALNEPSLRKFLPEAADGAWVLYNGARVPEGLERADVHLLAIDFTALADRLGDARAANIAALGSLVEAAGVVDEFSVSQALARLVQNPGWLEIDRKALAAGRDAFRQEALHDSV